jgi:hypothetical protein
MQADPGVRTARGLVRRGEQATQDRLFQDLRQRFIGNPQALSMLKYLEAQQKYGDRTLDTLKAAQLRPAQPMDTLPPDPSSVARPGEYQQASMPAQRMQPAQQPRQQIPQQQTYQSMRPRPGMVVNGYRLVNPAKPNDRASWQPVTEK